MSDPIPKSPDSEPDPRKARTLRHRPYLDKNGREIVNRSSRRICVNRPDHVDDPEDPSLSDVLVDLQRHGDTTSTDGGVIIDLLSEGLDYRETVVWYLWRFGGLDPSEIYHAEEGKQKSYSKDMERKAVRNINSVLQRAASKLGKDFDPDTSRSRTGVNGDD